MIKAIARLFLIAFVLFGMTGSISPENPYGDASDIFELELVNATATVTSDPFPIYRAQFFGVHYIATSATGAPDLDIVYELSTVTTGSTFVQPEGGGVVADDLTDELWHVDAISPTPMKYIRFVVTGNVANPADTVITLKLFTQ